MDSLEPVLPLLPLEPDRLRDRLRERTPVALAAAAAGAAAAEAPGLVWEPLDARPPRFLGIGLGSAAALFTSACLEDGRAPPFASEGGVCERRLALSRGGCAAPEAVATDVAADAGLGAERRWLALLAARTAAVAAAAGALLEACSFAGAPAVLRAAALDVAAGRRGCPAVV